MQELINKQTFHQFIKQENKHLAPFSGFLMELLQLTKINTFYNEVLNESTNTEEFIALVLKRLQINIKVLDSELDRIPESGSFITVSNHPFGGIDGLILLYIVLKKRPDFKVIANYLLKNITPLSNVILPVNSFEYGKEGSINGLKTALETIKNNCPIGIFPAGEVSTVKAKLGIVDKTWSITSIKLIKKAQVPVIPIYFEGANSHLFHVLGMINPKLRTAKLPSEVFNKKNKNISVSIGNPIAVSDLNQFDNTNELADYIRNRTYALKYINKFNNDNLKNLYYKRISQPINPLLPNTVLAEEVSQLSSDYLLLDNGTFQIYCTPAEEIPLVLTQIGILREITFREIGEGTGKATDIDKYDLYYHHLFLWDKIKQQLVGAYRIGKGESILKLYGKKGLYINSLFKLKKPLVPRLKMSLELGRSFIVKSYQKNPQPLFLLWKGILYFLIKNPNYRYLIGPVSISNDFTSISKELIVEFVKQNYFDDLIASFVIPRKKFKVNLKQTNIKSLVSVAKNDFSKLDKVIENIEPDKIRIPILLKKYIKQNAKIVGFNIDPKFNNALDGFVFLDLMEIPQTTIKQLSKEFNDEKIMDLFIEKEML